MAAKSDPFFALRLAANRCRQLEAELAGERSARDRLALRLIAAGQTWRAVAEAAGFENPYIAELKRRAARIAELDANPDRDE